MMEIGNSFANLTDPTVTTKAEEFLASNVSILPGGAGPHFTAENAVGTRSWLTMLSTI